MKILIVINALVYGGAEKQAVLDANEFAEMGHSVSVAYNGHGGLESLLSRKIRLYRIRLKNVLFASLQLFIHLLKCRYDVVHSHMFWAEKVSALPCFLTGHKLIFNEHGLGLWRRWYHIVVMRFISLCAASLITSCNAVRRVKVDREKIDPRKVYTVYNSVDGEHALASTVDKAFFRAARNSFIIGYVGRFNEVKRLHLLVDIARRVAHCMKGSIFVLVGDGAEKPRIESEIERNGLADFFRLPGYTLDTAPYYKSFDIFVLPSRIEGFSLALLESCSHGTPVIAFDVGGNPEIIKNGKTGYLIQECNVDELTQRILHLYGNRTILARMGRAAGSFVNDNFSLSNRVHALMRIYRGCSVQSDLP
jgi:glycosyltransferase involved in cell wall biosynthesis